MKIDRSNGLMNVLNTRVIYLRATGNDGTFDACAGSPSNVADPISVSLELGNLDPTALGRVVTPRFDEVVAAAAHQVLDLARRGRGPADGVAANRVSVRDLLGLPLAADVRVVEDGDGSVGGTRGQDEAVLVGRKGHRIDAAVMDHVLVKAVPAARRVLPPQDDLKQDLHYQLKLWLCHFGSPMPLLPLLQIIG